MLRASSMPTLFPYTTLFRSKGLFTGDIENVEIVKDLRFPRIIVSLVAGAALAVSGVLLQAVMRNPLAEPGIIGVSSGAAFVTILVVTFFPALFFYSLLFSFFGVSLSFFLFFFFFFFYF